MEKHEKRKWFLIGCGSVVIIFAAVVGAQIYVINNVPYTYRTSGLDVLATYLLGDPCISAKGIGAKPTEIFRLAFNKLLQKENWHVDFTPNR